MNSHDEKDQSKIFGVFLKYTIGLLEQEMGKSKFYGLEHPAVRNKKDRDDLGCYSALQYLRDRLKEILYSPEETTLSKIQNAFKYSGIRTAPLGKFGSYLMMNLALLEERYNELTRTPAQPLPLSTESKIPRARQPLPSEITKDSLNSIKSKESISNTNTDSINPRSKA